MVEQVLFFVFPCLVVLAGVSDLLTMTIPNKLTLATAAAFVVAALVYGLPMPEWGYHALAAAVVLVACFTMFALGWMGGGDAKLASAVALWLGWSDVLLAFCFWTALYGAALTIFIVLFRSRLPLLPGFLMKYAWIERLHDRKSGIPYGIAIAAAALQVYPLTLWFKAWVG